MGAPLPLFDRAGTLSVAAGCGSPGAGFAHSLPLVRDGAGRSSPGDPPAVPDIAASPPEPSSNGLCETPAADPAGCSNAPGHQPEGAAALTQHAIDNQVIATHLAVAPSIRSIIDLRQQHHAKGHTPETDQAHGPAFFTVGAHEFMAKAFRTRDPVKRRNRLVSAAAMLVALIDRDDFAAAAASSSPAVGENENAAAHRDTQAAGLPEADRPSGGMPPQGEGPHRSQGHGCARPAIEGEQE